MGDTTSKLKQKEEAKNTWKTQVEEFTTSKKANVDLCLPEFSATEIVTWKCHVDESTNCIYGMIPGRDLITTLGMDPKFSGDVIIGSDEPYEGWSEPMVEVSNYNFTSLTDKIVKPE